MRQFVAILGAAALGISVANAADMPLKARAPIATPLYGWTGLYVGVNGGGGWGRENWLDNNGFLPGMDFRPEGWMFGGQLGGRYQINQLVLGVEATADWADLRDEIVFAGGGERENLKVQALYTVTGQVGWAFDRWLPYVKGGWAAASTKAVFDSGGGDVATHSHEANGWTVGGGVDYAIWQNVILGVEYDHFELKYDPFTAQFPVGTPWVVTSSSRLTIDQVVARLSYKFDWH